MEIANPEDLTEDLYEREILTEEHLDYIEPDDPYYQEVCRIQHELAHINRNLPAKRRGVARLLTQGLSNTEIAQKLATTPQTVGKALQSEPVQRQLVLMQRLAHIQAGPGNDARRALLWRIAIREEERRPNTAIKAVDTLNKADGLYRPDDPSLSEGGVVIKIANFTVNSVGEAPKPPDGHDPVKEAEAIDAEFTPITVETPDE